MLYYYSPFRKEYDIPRINGCPFCDPNLVEKQSVRDHTGAIVANEHYYAMTNWYPKAEAHTMVVPKRHLLSLADETPEETLGRHDITLRLTKALTSLYPDAGIEMFFQTGKGSESSIPHLHWHVVPALVDDPVRGMGKFDHHFTSVPEEEKIILYPRKIQLAREELIQALAPHF